jgi:predicted DNA-binding transcriptional regulator YafY
MEEKKDLKRLTRIVKLLNILSAGKLAITSTAAELGVSIRTIQRDVRTIEDAGFPIASLKRGEMLFVEGYSINKAKLTNEEASIIIFMSDIIQSLGSDFTKSFKTLQKKISNDDAETPFYIKVPKSLEYQETAIVQTIKKAIKDKTTLMLTYAMRPENKLGYVFHPLKIINYDGFWYLLGMDYYKNIRKLKLYDILDAANTQERFITSKQLRKYIRKTLANSKNIWFGGNADKKITLKVFAEVAQYFKNKEIFPLQKIVQEDKDGSLILESVISQNREAIQIIIQWLPYISVISPIDLKEEIKQILEDAIKNI